MAQYRVVLTGFQDTSMDGMAEFYRRFGEAYHKSPKEARQWVEQARNILYRFEDLEAAEKARQYLEGLGAAARVEEAPPEPPAAPVVQPPASPDPGPVPGWDAGPMPGPAPGPVALPGSGAGSAWAYQHGAQPIPYQPPVKNYLRYHDLSSILSATFEIFFNNFLPLLLINLIQLIPALMIGIVGAVFAMVFVMGMGPLMSGAKPNPELFAGGMVAVVVLVLIVIMPVMIYLQMFCQCAMVFAAADAINGRVPDVRTCLKKVDYLMPLRLFITGLLPGLATIVCLAPSLALFILGAARQDPPFLIMGGVLTVLVIPLIIYINVLVMFFPQAVVLEGVWMLDAINRSIELSRGYRLRNLGIMIVMSLVIFVPALVINCIAGFIPLVGSLAGIVVQFAIVALIMIAMMLLYYDLRLREQAVGGGSAGPVPGAVAAPSSWPADAPPVSPEEVEFRRRL